MSDKKSFFGFLKKWTTQPNITSYTTEEAAQRQYATTTIQDDRDSSHSQPPSNNPSFAEQTEPKTLNIPSEGIEYCAKKLEEILNLASFGGKVVFQRQEEDKLFFEIQESEDVGRIIGKDGMTLDAFQTLTKAFLFKKYNIMAKIYLDIENYRNKREDMLKNHALKSAKAVLSRNRKIDLKPMNPDERRLIHNMFQNDKRIRSYSVGTGVYRHIVLERRGPRKTSLTDEA